MENKFHYILSHIRISKLTKKLYKHFLQKICKLVSNLPKCSVIYNMCNSYELQCTQYYSKGLGKRLYMKNYKSIYFIIVNYHTHIYIYAYMHTFRQNLITGIYCPSKYIQLHRFCWTLKFTQCFNWILYFLL